VAGTAREPCGNEKSADFRPRFFHLADKLHFPGRSKSHRCKAQEKFRADAYQGIREVLNFSRQRSRWGFFSGMKKSADFRPRFF